VSKSPIPENTAVFQVVFHPAMRDALLQWADLCGYEIAQLAEEDFGALPTYVAVLRSMPGRLAQRCMTCGQLIDVATPGGEHEIVYRQGEEGQPTPFVVVHRAAVAWRG